MSASGSGRRSVVRWTVGWVACVLVVAVSGVGHTYPALALTQAGHWLYARTLGALFHVDGATSSVDAKMPGMGQLSPSAQVGTGQDAKFGYMVDSTGRMIKFSKSTLHVEQTLSAPREKPIVLDGIGGPYVVYQQHGEIVRLSDDHTFSAGSGRHLMTPVLRTDGTLWVQRTSAGSSRPDALCEIGPASTRMSCTTRVPVGEQGSLVTLNDQAALVNTRAGTISPVTSHGLGKSIPGVPKGADVKVASADADGRLPLVVQGHNGQPSKLVLVDVSTMGSDRATPLSVPLGDGDFSTPYVAGPAIVVVNRDTNTIDTFDNHGKHVDRASGGSGTLELYRGDDGRVYVDNDTTARSYVVDGDGSVTAVDVTQGGGGSGPAGPAPSKSQTPHKKKPSAPTSSSSSSPAKTPTSSPTVSAPAKTSPRPSSSLPNLPGLPSDAKPRHNPKPSAPPTFPTPKPSDTGTGGTGNGSGNGRNDDGNNGGNKDKPGNNGGGRDSTPPASHKPSAEAPDAPASVHVKPATIHATVSWTTPSANGAKISGYKITWQQRGCDCVKSMSVGPHTHKVELTHLKADTRYSVRVAAKNRVGPGAQSASKSFRTKKRKPTTPGNGTGVAGSCVAAAKSDGATLIYSLTEDGSTANDLSGNGHTGSVSGGVTHEGSGPCPDDGGRKATFDGTGVVTSNDTFTGTQTAMSVEAWFNTQTNAGGGLVGFGSNLPGNASHFDRQIYMLNSGQLSFSVFNDKPYEAISPKSYNDGQWHSVVGTLSASGMALYVDGQLVATNANSGHNPPFDGHWNIGYQDLALWPNRSTSNYYAGCLAYVSVYDHALSASAVKAHDAAGR